MNYGLRAETCYSDADLSIVRQALSDSWDSLMVVDFQHLSPLEFVEQMSIIGNGLLLAYRVLFLG